MVRADWNGLCRKNTREGSNVHLPLASGCYGDVDESAVVLHSLLWNGISRVRAFLFCRYRLSRLDLLDILSRNVDASTNTSKGLEEG